MPCHSHTSNFFLKIFIKPLPASFTGLFKPETHRHFLPVSQIDKETTPLDWRGCCGVVFVEKWLLRRRDRRDRGWWCVSNRFLMVGFGWINLGMSGVCVVDGGDCVVVVDRLWLVVVELWGWLFFFFFWWWWVRWVWVWVWVRLSFVTNVVVVVGVAVLVVGGRVIDGGGGWCGFAVQW